MGDRFTTRRFFNSPSHAYVTCFSYVIKCDTAGRGNGRGRDGAGRGRDGAGRGRSSCDDWRCSYQKYSHQHKVRDGAHKHQARSGGTRPVPRDGRSEQAFCVDLNHGWPWYFPATTPFFWFRVTKLGGRCETQNLHLSHTMPKFWALEIGYGHTTTKMMDIAKFYMSSTC